jgi:hypothetical protein
LRLVGVGVPRDAQTAPVVVSEPGPAPTDHAHKAETVKTRLGLLFQKTGVGRQADLVKLVAEFSNPFLH